MGANSKIEWCDHTFNPWIGCTRVSPGCDRCYAEAMAKRHGWAGWGAGEPRRRTGDANWHNPGRWNRAAAARGTRMRVFCASLADVFDNEVPEAWRSDLWGLIQGTPQLDWLLLTKRIGNAEKMLPEDWGDGYGNFWLGASVVNQAEADRDIPKLLRIRAAKHFVSYEPALGPVDFTSLKHVPGEIHNALTGEWRRDDARASPYEVQDRKIDWVIAGGESGPSARPMHPDWARAVRHQCAAIGTAFFFKQWGEWAPDGDGPVMNRVGKKASGAMLDGREWREFPA